MDTARYLDPFAAHLAQSGLAAATVAAYLRDVRSLIGHLESRWGMPLRPANITDSDLRSYRVRLAADRSVASANRACVAIRRWLNWCAAEGLVERPDLHELAWTPHQSIGVAAPGPEELDRLTRAAERRSRLWAAAVWLLRSTGCTAGELVAAQLDDFDIQPARIVWHIRGRGFRDRRVVLSPGARQALERYLEVRPWQIYQPQLFLARSGRPLSTRGVRYIVQTVSGGRWHPGSLRHAWGQARLAKRPQALISVARQLGHSDLRTAMLYLRASSA